MSLKSIFLIGLLSVSFLAGGCASPDAGAPGNDAVTLKKAFDGRFAIGAALNGRQFAGRDSLGARLVAEQFNSTSPENVLKWESIHPQPGQYAFDAPDQYVAFGEEHDMMIIGHTLVWHSQTPRWVFEDATGNPVSRDTLLARMRDHIHTVVGRYKGRVTGWDVVNEALNEDGTLRQSPWMQIIGPDYLAKAFEYAREADPDAGLYYNDYSLAYPDKRNGAVELIRNLQAQNAPVTGIGMQGHYNLMTPTLEQFEGSLSAFSDLGIDIMITEFDIDVLPAATRRQTAEVSENVAAREELNPYAEGLPDSMQTALATRYGDLFRVLLDYSNVVTRVTFWGVTDGDSWKNNWPVRGRTNYPLLFDRSGEPKPAFYAVIQTVR